MVCRIDNEDSNDIVSMHDARSLRRLRVTTVTNLPTREAAPAGESDFLSVS